MGIGTTHIDHIVISSNDSGTVAQTFADNLGIEIKRKMIRPGTSRAARIRQAQEVVLEFCRPARSRPAKKSGGETLGWSWRGGFDAAVAHLRGLGYPVRDPRPACSRGAKIASVKDGTSGRTVRRHQYNAISVEEH